MSPKERTRKRETCKTNRRSKKFARSYSLNNPETKESIPVCQKFFLNTLSIDEKRVRTAIAKTTNAGALEPDFRGTHENHANSKERQEKVIKHIQLFQVVESHYVRKDTKFEYLPDTLNITEMHRLYLEWCAEKDYIPENYSFYKRVFHEHFNLKFQKPKKDLCHKCTAFKNTPTEARTKDACDQHEKHIKQKKLAREFKESMKNEANKSTKVLTAAFDLEKVLLAPHGQTSSFYYSRRLKTTTSQ